MQRKYRTTDIVKLPEQRIPSNLTSFFQRMSKVALVRHARIIATLSQSEDPPPLSVARPVLVRSVTYCESFGTQVPTSTIVVSATTSHHCSSCLSSCLHVHSGPPRNSRQAGQVPSVPIPQCGVPSFQGPAPKIDTPFQWLEGTFDIICLLDKREVKDAENRYFVYNELRKRGVKGQGRELDLGDVLCIEQIF